MIASKSKPHAAISRAVLDLRTHLGSTQEAFSRLTGYTLRTISRWELETPPSGSALKQLWQLARENGANSAAAIFLVAIRKEFINECRTAGLTTTKQLHLLASMVAGYEDLALEKSAKETGNG